MIKNRICDIRHIPPCMKNGIFFLSKNLYNYDLTRKKISATIKLLINKGDKKCR